MDGKTVDKIIVRGDNVMKAYWKLPDETKIAIIGGYFHTPKAIVALKPGVRAIKKKLF
ncbi:MAG: hypothetical protein HY881_28180 [Deltaproteobacteria bacterium]|nr:hypothetical protein [Deltaproteobacteria bacterium]